MSTVRGPLMRLTLTVAHMGLYSIAVLNICIRFSSSRFIPIRSLASPSQNPQEGNNDNNNSYSKHYSLLEMI